MLMQFERRAGAKSHPSMQGGRLFFLTHSENRCGSASSPLNCELYNPA